MEKDRLCIMGKFNAKIYPYMRKIAFGLLGSLVLFYGAAAQRVGDTQSVTTRLTAQPALYSKNAIMDYFQNQQFDEAIAYLVPLLQADSTDVPLLGYAGYAYFMNDNTREAATCYRRILGLDSNNVGALHYLVLLRSNDDPAEAIGYAARLLALQPERAPWWRTMGELSFRRGQPDTAMWYYEQAYSMAPGDVRTVADLSELLINKLNFHRADSILDLGLDKDSMNSSLLKLRVKSAFFSKNYAEAIKPGERLASTDEPATQALTWLALSYYELKQYPECIHVCDHMLEIGLQSEQVYYYEAGSYGKMKQYTTSDSLLHICLTIAVSRTAEWYYDQLGSNHEALGSGHETVRSSHEALKEYKAAIASYDTAYYLFKDPTTLYACGRIAETELHNMTTARRYYLRYLAVAKPKTKDEKDAVAYIRKRWAK
jgi:tetratricopeptide (TPR) repeat protein